MHIPGILHYSGSDGVADSETLKESQELRFAHPPCYRNDILLLYTHDLPYKLAIAYGPSAEITRHVPLAIFSSFNSSFITYPAGGYKNSAQLRRISSLTVSKSLVGSTTKQESLCIGQSVVPLKRDIHLIHRHVWPNDTTRRSNQSFLNPPVKE